MGGESQDLVSRIHTEYAPPSARYVILELRMFLYVSEDTGVATGVLTKLGWHPCSDPEEVATQKQWMQMRVIDTLFQAHFGL